MNNTVVAGQGSILRDALREKKKKNPVKLTGVKNSLDQSLTSGFILFFLYLPWFLYITVLFLFYLYASLQDVLE
jgi:hypothetical protein